MDMFDHETPTAAAKTRDYRNLFTIQAAMLTTALLLADLLHLLNVRDFKVFYHTLYIGLGGAYFYLLWDLLKNFVESRKKIAFFFFSMLGLFLAIVVLLNPFVTLVSNPVPGLIVVHIGLLAIEALVIVAVFRDVFSRRSMSKNSLWGAVSLFLMMTISFASVYDLLNMIAPGSFGFPLEPGFQTYSESLYCSLAAIGGGTPSYSSPTLLVRNVVALEGVAGNLYMVVLIGRIVGRLTTE